MRATGLPATGVHGASRSLEHQEPLLRRLCVVALTINAGATDAVGFLALGEAFTSVMTGNLVLIGIAAANRDASLAAHIGTAVAGYVLGCIAGAQVSGVHTREGPVWSGRVTAAIGIEFTLLLASGLLWWSAGSAPSARLGILLLGVNAVALGIQSSAVLKVRPQGPSSTYMTGNLTKLIATFSTGGHRGTRWSSVEALLALALGGLVGGILVRTMPGGAPVIQLVAVGFALLGSSYIARHGESRHGDSQPRPAMDVQEMRAADAPT